MVRAFIDTVQNENIRIGYVAYNDDILSCSEPELMAMAEKREALKEEIGGIMYSRDTDIGLGISYAYELFSTGNDTRRIMVLISDGETDLPKGSERTVEQSDKELEQCVSQCKEEGIQVYTVAFGHLLFTCLRAYHQFPAHRVHPDILYFPYRIMRQVI